MADTEKTVAVLGGGVAGLSAAHHLNARGYRVTVFEARGRTPDELGGKARSYRVDPRGKKVPGDGATKPAVPGGEDKYGEHGFRFFPGFYSHVTETMRQVAASERDDAATVEDLLRPLEETSFYARKIEQPAPKRSGTPTPEWHKRVDRGNERLDRWSFKVGSVLFLGWLAWGCLLFYWAAPIWWLAFWFGAPVGWLIVRTVLVALTASTGAELSLELPVGRRTGRKNSWLQRWLLRVHPWARFVGVAAAFAALAAFDRPWRLLPLVLLVATAIWYYPALATMNYLWGLVGRIPLSVRPGILESVVAFLRVTAVVTSSPRRLYSQWESNSWWSFIEAYRYSRYFRLAFATGLTRSFVATRAEAMSARTGATILTQLLFDASPTLRSRERPADRVLCAPTHEAWITPWVHQLESRGVRFNEFDGDLRFDSVEVTSLVVCDAGHCIRGFEFIERGDRTARIHHATNPAPQPAPQAFDHYVLAVSGTAAQRILANSPSVVRADRRKSTRPSDPLGTRRRVATSQGKQRTATPVPYLDGIFKLEFGWMTGIVYHLEEEVTLPKGHLLCLESEWALTAVEQRSTWAECPGPWNTLLSVNISDWFSASRSALPARFETVEAVADETWQQLRNHIPALAHIDKTPPSVLDTAIEDPDPVTEAQNLATRVGSTTTTAALENLELVNDEKLLVNTAGSWEDRPTARTAFANLVIAGDYVRTWTDFASMESADESARRAVNVILESDGRHEDPCCVRELPIPPEFRFPLALVRGIDQLAIRARWPHPMMLLATPIGWGAGLEVILRRWVRGFRVRDEPPV